MRRAIRAPDCKEVAMARLREYWLETLATGVTVVLLAFTCAVFIGYAAGPTIGTQHAAMAQKSDQAAPALQSALR
jgi:hypothetical protein